MDPSLIRFQERQVLIMLKCIICIITSRETQEGKLFIRETRVLSFHFWKVCPLNLKHSGGGFRGQKHKQLWAGFMIHICGLKVFSYSCPGMESWACQGCTHFLPKQPVVPLIFRYRGRKDSRPCLQQPLELAWVGPGCPGAGQVRREELRPSSPLQGEVGLPLPAGAAGLADSGQPAETAAVSSSLVSPPQTGSVAPDTDEVGNQESQWFLGMLSNDPQNSLYLNRASS